VWSEGDCVGRGRNAINHTLRKERMRLFTLILADTARGAVRGTLEVQT
jgi:hypothetical protein